MPTRQVLRYCIHTIVLLRGPSGADGVGLNEYGEPNDEPTPTSLTLAARFEFDNSRIIDDSGEEVVCAGRIFIPPTYTHPVTGVETELNIGPQDRVVFEGRTYAMATRPRIEAWTSDRGRHWDVFVR